MAVWADCFSDFGRFNLPQLRKIAEYEKSFTAPIVVLRIVIRGHGLALIFDIVFQTAASATASALAMSRVSSLLRHMRRALSVSCRPSFGALYDLAL
jgi:hypothetical protein